jgi:transcriptional regulator with XRE-family HTH domain
MTMIDTPTTKAAEEPILPSIGTVSGKKVRQIREEHGLTYDQLTEAVGISHESILGIESGVFQPTNQVIVAIARTFGVPTRAILVDPPTALAEVAEALGTEQPASMRRTIEIEDDDAPEPEPVAEEEDVPEIPRKPRGWKHISDVEQRLRLYAAREAADILRETGGAGVFSTGSTKSVNPNEVILLAGWIVYGE